MEEINHQAEFCVVGGGLAGMAAAVAAARFSMVFISVAFPLVDV